MSKLITRLEATIANGASLSNSILVDNLSPIILEMPTSWTAACLSFQASGDNVNFFNVYDEDGLEVVIPAAATQRIFLPSRYFQYAKKLKVRSGTNLNAVNQGAERLIYVELWES